MMNSIMMPPDSEDDSNDAVLVFITSDKEYAGVCLKQLSSFQLSFNK